MVWPRGDVESGEKDILESDQTCIVRPKSKKRGTSKSTGVTVLQVLEWNVIVNHEETSKRVRRDLSTAE